VLVLNDCCFGKCWAVTTGAGDMSRVPSVEHRVSALLAEDLLSTTGFLTPFLTIRGELSIILGVWRVGWSNAPAAPADYIREYNK
jgi:hypothetical protein